MHDGLGYSTEFVDRAFAGRFGAGRGGVLADLSGAAFEVLSAPKPVTYALHDSQNGSHYAVGLV